MCQMTQCKHLSDAPASTSVGLQQHQIAIAAMSNIQQYLLKVDDDKSGAEHLANDTAKSKHHHTYNGMLTVRLTRL